MTSKAKFTVLRYPEQSSIAQRAGLLTMVAAIPNGKMRLNWNC